MEVYSSSPYLSPPLSLLASPVPSSLPSHSALSSPLSRLSSPLPRLRVWFNWFLVWQRNISCDWLHGLKKGIRLTKIWGWFDLFHDWLYDSKIMQCILPFEPWELFASSAAALCCTLKACASKYLNLYLHNFEFSIYYIIFDLVYDPSELFMNIMYLVLHDFLVDLIYSKECSSSSNTSNQIVLFFKSGFSGFSKIICSSNMPLCLDSSVFIIYFFGNISLLVMYMIFTFMMILKLLIWLIQVNPCRTVDKDWTGKFILK